MARLLITLVVFFIILGIRFFYFFENAPQLQDGEEIIFETTLLSDPKLQSRFQQLTVSYEGRERVFISTSRFPLYTYGQKLLIEGRIEKKQVEEDRFIWTMSYPRLEAKVSENRAVQIARAFRMRVTQTFSSFIPFPSSSLFIGIVFGIKEGMPDDLTDKLTKTGIIHITAASGMNITLLAGAVFLIFGSLFHRKTALWISLGALWMYAVVAGFDASIVRASIMASIAFTAALLGRQNAAWYALVITGFIMLFLNPSNIFDLGFQLSLGSTAGILFLVPLMGRETIKKGELWFLADDFKATTAAQIATIPLMLSNFGSYGIFSILVNLLVLWSIPFLMILGGIAALVSFIHPILSVPFLYLSLPFLMYIELVVNVTSEFLPTIQIKSFPLMLSASYYLLLLATVIYLYRKRRKTT